MKFGKLSNIEDVDFGIPNLRLVNHKENADSNFNLYLGTTGWSNKEWNGSYYPKGTNSSSFLTEYGKLFNTIELNSTHYHIPPLERVDKWHSMVNDDFTFCPKVPQDISHRSNLASETSQTLSFIKSISRFKENLGPCFMQLPEYFSPKEADKLLHFINRKPLELKFAVELRHKGWFTDDSRQLKILAERIKGLNTTFVITDVAGRRDVCHGILPEPTLLVRLVGNAGHTSDNQRMNSWIDRILSNKAQLNNVFIFFHQPTMEDIPNMINFFIEKLEEKGLNSPISLVKPKYQPNIQLGLF